MVKKAIRDCLGPCFSSARRGRLFSTNDVTWGFIDESGSLRPSAGQQSGGRQSIIAFLTRIRQKTRATCAYARDLRTSGCGAGGCGLFVPRAGKRHARVTNSRASGTMWTSSGARNRGAGGTAVTLRLRMPPQPYFFLGGAPLSLPRLRAPASAHLSPRTHRKGAVLLPIAEPRSLLASPPSTSQALSASGWFSVS